ncbi:MULTISPECIES: hypothetical protein [unclassified Pseudoalteromonas]|uniref:hypothetical protein n=1 Tax=unclassified Pseudoalteromonas TaxID=194690 RepID=UPI0020981DF1|nr:hypothetical protein [Pseudoalteromonas sp. XMcav2-N]MCO7189973.1 hypothetical protein [Pseudoalteromonas sp. XMcav2-N]
MKYLQSLMAVCIALNLSACGDDDRIHPPGGGGEVPDSGRVVHDIALSSPSAEHQLVEDFPVTQYLTYDSGAQPLTSLTSIDVNWPKIHTFQQGIEVGLIDASTESLIYRPLDIQLSALDSIVATELFEHELWYVKSSNELYRRNLHNGETRSWRFGDKVTLTELAIDNENNREIWSYNGHEHEIYRFSPETELLLRYPLSDNMTIQGLSFTEEQLWLLAAEQGQAVVFQFEVAQEQLNPANAWRVSGFGQTEFTDLTLMPDGRVAVASNAQENNLFLLADRDKLLGDGPIADSGNLAVQRRFTLPEGIKQPSGLWQWQSGGWEIVTDQAEVYSLNENLEIQSRSKLVFSSINCSQGCTEAVTGTADGLFVLADNGLVGHFIQTEQGYELAGEFGLTLQGDDAQPLEFAGIAYDEQSHLFFLVSDSDDESQQDWLFTLDHQFNLMSRQPLSYAGEIDGSINEYTAQGLYFADGALWLLSEQFTKVVKLNLSAEVVAVYDLLPEDMAIPSDLVVKEDKVYLIGDHENDEPVPPLTEFTIE